MRYTNSCPGQQHGVTLTIWLFVPYSWYPVLGYICCSSPARGIKATLPTSFLDAGDQEGTWSNPVKCMNEDGHHMFCF